MKMAAYRLSGLFLCWIIFAAECSNVDILQRLAKLEELQLGCALKNNVLEEKVKLLENKLKAHGLEDQHMATSIKGCASKNNVLEEKVKHLENKLKAHGRYYQHMATSIKGCASKNNVLEEKVKLLENKLKAHGLEDQHMATSIKGCASKNNVLEEKVKLLENKLKAHGLEDQHMATSIKGCASKNNVLEEKVKLLENKLKAHGLEDQHMATSIKALKEKDESLTRVITELTSNQAAFLSEHRRQSGAGHVAFSTFLTHDVNLVNEQVIIFNAVQLNDGHGYNRYTGAFTVPMGGVYVFTFFIGQRDENQLFVKLVVNGVTKSDAVAETVQQDHDAQGGNVVVLRVTTGDVVMVEHNTWGSHIEGYPDIRLSTFSGFRLY